MIKSNKLIVKRTQYIFKKHRKYAKNIDTCNSYGTITSCIKPHNIDKKGSETDEQGVLQFARINQAVDLGGSACPMGSKKARHPINR